jgi:DNA-directed RNA polymerase specialized sigma subunit
LEHRQQLVAVNAAFAELNEQERTVLSLLYVEEMTATAVAEQLGHRRANQPDTWVGRGQTARRC